MRNIEIKSFALVTLIILSFLSVFISAMHKQHSYSDDMYAMPEPFSSGPLYSNQAFDKYERERLVWKN